MIRAVWLLSFAIACARNGSNEPPAPEPPAEAPVQADRSRTAGSAPDPVEPKPPASTPAELYAECRDRVEQPEAEGECTTDADCVRAGCGSEVCTTATDAEGLVSTCEDRICFHVLDTCGCHDGRCSWTLKDEMPDLEGLVPAPGDAPQ